MSQQQERSQVVHVRENSNSEMDALFDVLKKQESQQVPLRMRKLPPSFFKPPDPGQRSGNHSREGSQDASNYGGLVPMHSRAHSSPATLQGTLSTPAPPHHHHMRQQSYDPIADDGLGQLPGGWEMAKTPQGQKYYLNHITQTTTWIDPRIKSNSNSNLNQTSPPQSHHSPNVSQQNLGPLPPGWEQSVTPEGEVYFINHHEKATSWFDPRIPIHLQQRNKPSHQAGIAAPQHFHNQGQGQLARNPPTSLVAPQGPQPDNQRKMQLHKLQIEKEMLLRRQEEINRQEMMIRHNLGEDPNNIQNVQHTPNEMQSVNTSGVDPFLGHGGSTDFHARQESGDSGLGGMGTSYSLPRTPEDLLGNMDDMDTSEGGHKLQEMNLGNIAEGNEASNMDSEDLVPSLHEDISSELLNDISALTGQDNLTWL